MPKKPQGQHPHTTEEHPFITVTYSELDSYRQCPLKWDLSYVKGWRQPAKVGSPLTRGSLWHNVLEVHYTWLQRDPNANLEHIREFVRKHLLFNTEHPDEDQILVDWMYDGYLECYGRDPGWEIIGVENAYRIHLGPPSSHFRLAMKLDLLVREKKTDNLLIIDHKTAADFSRPTEIDVDDQFGLYTWGLRREGLDIFGFVRSDSRTRRNKTKPMTMDQRFRRVTTFRTKVELANIAADAYDCARAMYSSGRIIHSSPAPDRCSWRCGFLQPHLLHRKGIPFETSLPDYGFEISQEKHREYAPNPLIELIPV